MMKRGKKMNYLLWTLIGYVAGCINGSQIIGKIKGVDIKNSGVKNAGASNTAILLGWKFGIIVGLIDILKAIIPILILHQIGGEHQETLMYLTGLCVILGHNYPITMKFKGGKGTASLIGLLFALDWKIGLISFVLLVLVALLTDYLVIGVLIMYVSFITMTALFDYGVIPLVIAISLTLLSVVMHIENYQRIGKKTEKKVSSMFKKKR